jgi:hypothetical protein
MPTLPTLTVTQVQADKIMAAFGTPAAYKAWLQEQVVQYVIQNEYRAKQDDLFQQQNDDAIRIRGELT